MALRFNTGSCFFEQILELFALKYCWSLSSRQGTKGILLVQVEFKSTTHARTHAHTQSENQTKDWCFHVLLYSFQTPKPNAQIKRLMGGLVLRFLKDQPDGTISVVVL